jgi:hypothetical protein
VSNDLTAQIVSALQEYSNTCEEQIQEVLQDVAKDAKKRLSSTSPKRKGQYKKGWKVTLTRRKGFCKVDIHNTRYQLTHLLEKGHRVGSGRSPAIVHIKPVEEWAIQEAEKRIKEVLSG